MRKQPDKSAEQMSRQELEETVRAYRQGDRLQEEEIGLAHVLRDCPVGVVLTEAMGDQEIFYANRTFCRMTGYDYSEVVGKNCRFLQGEQTSPEAIEEIRKSLKNYEPYQGTLTNYRKDGESFKNQLTIAPVYDHAGKPQYFIGFQNDVTERRRYQSQLQEQNELLDAVNDQMPGVAYEFKAYYDGGFEFTYMSEGYDKIAGVTSDQAVDDFEEAIKNIPDEEQEELLASIIKAVDNQEDWRYESRFVWPDGTTRYGLGQSRPVREEEDGLVFYGIIIDTTARRLMEDKLKLQNKRRDLAQDMAEIGHWIVEPEGAVTWSDEVYTILGWDLDNPPETVEEALQVYPENQRGEVKEAISQALTRGKQINMEADIQRKDGEQRTVHIIGEPRYEKGEIRDVFGVFSDITERKRRERQLEQLADEREALVREVHHRVRNNLQVVSSIIGMEERKVNGKEKQALGRFRNRIQAMGLAHRFLQSNKGLAAVGPKKYFTQLISSLEKSLNFSATITFGAGVEEEAIGIDKVIPLGLALNEAISIIGLSKEVMDFQCSISDNHLVLGIAGEGVKWGDQKGFRIKLVNRLITEQLHGTLSKDQNTLTITIPLDETDRL